MTRNTTLLLCLIALTSPAFSAKPPASVETRGVVWADVNGNGMLDAGEKGVSGVAVSNGDTVVVTNATGAYRIVGYGTGVVFVSVPDGWQMKQDFWHSIPVNGVANLAFALQRVTRNDGFLFVHASDTHISQASVARTQRLRALVDSIKPAFVIVTGDLVKDALRVSEAEATAYYELFNAEAGKFTVPVWTVPGNHENFGIERELSKVPKTNPLYGRKMYHTFRGPDYYSFNAGGVHFVGLNSVDIDDMWYYGHVDSLQLAWLKRDLGAVPETMPVVTFNHIPFFSTAESMNGYVDGPPAPSLITVGGKTSYRHTVQNARDVIARIKPHPYPVALGGHVHFREQLRYEGVTTRFDQAAAIAGPSTAVGTRLPSGVTVYRVRRGVIGEGRFVSLGLDGEKP